MWVLSLQMLSHSLSTTSPYPDDPETFKGAPIGLQLVGRTLEEEAVIAMTEVVDAAIKKLQGSEGTLPDQ
jgi:Asp-tRNA(Asn)/Glu-tRNA(Gln) amidotransferase A subunit family amidase